MNAKKIKELSAAKDGLLRGEITPGRVYTLELAAAATSLIFSASAVACMTP